MVSERSHQNSGIGRLGQFLFITMLILLVLLTLLADIILIENKKLKSLVLELNVDIQTNCANIQINQAELSKITAQNLALEQELDALTTQLERQLEQQIEPEITSDFSRSEPETEYAYNVSESEKHLFVQIISAEADSGWGIEGYRYLAQVTINQMNSRTLGDTLHGVLTYPNNYSVIDNGRYLTVPISEKAEQAVAEVLRGEIFLPSEVMWYCTTDVKMNSFHSKLHNYTQYKNVIFFTK